jgi:ERCC4-type nuclease
MDAVPVHLVVDDRERASGTVLEALAVRGDATVEIARLRVGDYRVESRVVVERKTAADFAASLVDGRLFRQAAALVAAPERAVLILEGSDTDWQDTGVRHEAIQGALITIGVFFGVAVLRSNSSEETARLLVYLGRQARRSAQGGLHRPGYRPTGKRARQIFLLQGLPGVGPERAARLLERFGSVEAIMVASVEDLAAVDGIGEKTAAKMRWAVEESVMKYGRVPPSVEHPSSHTSREFWQPDVGGESMNGRHEDRGQKAAVRHAPSDVKAEADEVDLSLLDESLRLTPWERMLANDDALNFAESLRRAMEKRYAEPQ